jgi:hypothetical protein
MGAMAAPNPFHYGTPAEGDYFTGRREELDALVSRIRNGINVVLVAPRRYGKTSLHRAAQARLERSRPPAAVIEVNLLRAGSLPRFAGLLTAGAYHIRGARWSKARQAVPEYLRRLRVSPMVTFDVNGNPRFGFDAGMVQPDVETVLSDVYAVLAEEAARRPAALILDEFQAITRLAENMPDVLKGLADEHPNVSLVLAGSKRHLMEELVLHQHAPLFGMAQRLALGPIPEAEMVTYLAARSLAGGKPMDSDTAAYIVQRAGPVPNDIQHLAYDAFEAAGAVVDVAAADRGLATAVGHDAMLYAENFGRLSPGQARVLVTVAVAPPAEPYSSSFARSVGLASGSSVRKALQPLLDNEDVVERDGRLAVGDPFYAEWLRGEQG